MLNLAVNASDPDGLDKVSVSFGENVGTYVLCDDTGSPSCVGTSFNSGTHTFWPENYGARENQNTAIGLWVRDDYGNIERVDEHTFYWETNSNGSISQPSGSSAEGLVSFTASNLSDPQGVNKVSITFNESSQALVLCDNSQTPSCGQSSYTSAAIFPSDYDVSPGTLQIGLWMKDNAGNTERLAVKSLSWTLDATGNITSPGTEADGLITVSANATGGTGDNGLSKVSVVFTQGGAPLVLCDNSQPSIGSCTGSSWTKTLVDPRNHGVSGNGPVNLVLGLWTVDGAGHTERPDTQSFRWTSDASGAIAQPTASTVTGMMNLAVNAADPDGLDKISVTFGNNAGTYVLCDDAGTQPCSGTSFTSGTHTFWPGDYGAIANQTTVIGLWVRDDSGFVEMADSHSFTWAANSSGLITAPSGSSAEGLVSFTASGLSDPQGISKVSLTFNDSSQALVLCDDLQSPICNQTSFTSPAILPSDYGVSPGSLQVGLWLKDDAGNTERIAIKNLSWAHDATGSITSPGTEADGLITVSSANANGGPGDGLSKVSVVFTQGGSPLVLCDNNNASIGSCTGSSFAKTLVDPRNHGVSGNGPVDLVLGLWTVDGAGNTERPATHNFRWSASNASGSFTSPSTTATGPFQIAATATDTNGLERVWVDFDGGQPLDLCNDAGTTACAGTSTSLTASGVNPADHGITAAGSITLGLWILDDRGGSHRAATRTIQWTPQTIYPDVSSWAQEAAQFMVDHGIVEDNPQHLLRGTSIMNRAELATMLYRTLGDGLASADGFFNAAYGGVPAPVFGDVVDPDVWYHKPVTYLGLLSYVEDSQNVTVFNLEPGVFRPAQDISRAWTLKALLEAINQQPLGSLAGVSPLYTDVPTSHPAAPYIYKARQLGILSYDAATPTFRPDVSATREDLFVMLHRSLDSAANVANIVVPIDSPTSADFERSGLPGRIGHRYEQPILSGVTPPSFELSVFGPRKETIGILTGIYTADLSVDVTVDPGTYTDSQGVSHTANPFCAWEASGGSFIDQTPAGDPQFCSVKWIAPIDVSSSTGTAATYEIKLYVGDGLGSEVKTVHTLNIGEPSTDPTQPNISLDPLPTSLIGGQWLEILGDVADAGDASSASFGILKVEVFSSWNGGTSWTSLGPAQLLGEGRFRFAWLLPRIDGTLSLRAEATNLRGNRRMSSIRTMSVDPNFTLEGMVVDSYGVPQVNALVVLAGGSLSHDLRADNEGRYLFDAILHGLTAGPAYQVTASAGDREATVAGLVFSGTTTSYHHVLRLDNAPPWTVASPDGGEYRDPINVELICTDGDTDCAATYYTLDGTLPTVTSTLYTGPIALSADTTLSFFSVDIEGNEESHSQLIYTFDNCQPPATGDWVLTASCTYNRAMAAPANVLVEPGVVLTIEPGAILEIDLHTYKLLVRQGGGVLVRQGGTVRQTSGTLNP